MDDLIGRLRRHASAHEPRKVRVLHLGLKVRAVPRRHLPGKVCLDPGEGFSHLVLLQLPPHGRILCPAGVLLFERIRRHALFHGLRAVKPLVSGKALCQCREVRLPRVRRVDPIERAQLVDDRRHRLDLPLVLVQPAHALLYDLLHRRIKVLLVAAPDQTVKRFFLLCTLSLSVGDVDRLLLHLRLCGCLLPALLTGDVSCAHGLSACAREFAFHAVNSFLAFILKSS